MSDSELDVYLAQLGDKHDQVKPLKPWPNRPASNGRMLARRGI
jgi:hypothetical protein